MASGKDLARESYFERQDQKDSRAHESTDDDVDDSHHYHDFNNKSHIAAREFLDKQPELVHPQELRNLIAELTRSAEKE